jgi:hypothetical protein
MDSHLIDTTRNNLFNTSYSPVYQNGQLQFHGYGRPKKGHDKLYLKIINPSGNIISSPREIELPPEVLDTHVGEVKGFILNDQFYIYTNFFGKRKSLNIFPQSASKNAIELYFKSDYKNYLWNINTGNVIPLFYDILPGPGLTHKNFLFFQDENKTLVITSISPHRIYELDMNTGYMQPHVITSNMVVNFLGSDYRVNLSGGPVRIPERGCYLVAGHVSKGGWGGLRMTFFYTFRDSYPYDVISISNPMCFGFSNKLEYCNQMFEHGGSLYLSIGVNDDYSTLISLDIKNILDILIYQDNLTLQFVEVHPGENAFTCDMTRIWGPDVEAEFIAEILPEYRKISSTLDSVKLSSVLAINIDKYNKNEVREAIDKTKPKVLLVLGDEWGKCKSYESLFSGIPLVYRQYRFDHYDNPNNVRILPVGYHCWDQNARKQQVGKKYVWSFIGSSKNNRKRDLAILDNIKPNFHGTTKSHENPEILNGSIFVYCPKGSYNVESPRPYTASMCGAIPFLLCSDAEWNSLYPYMDIEPPWLHTNKIEVMKDEMERLLKNPQELMRIQQDISRWWNNIRALVHNNINEVIVNSRKLSLAQDPIHNKNYGEYEGNIGFTKSGITTIIITAPHKAIPSPKFIEQTIRSLEKVPLFRDSHVIIGFDGCQVINKDLHKKCTQEFSCELYNTYKNNVKKIAHMYLPRVTFVELPERGCLTTLLFNCMTKVDTEFVNVMQQDLPIIKGFNALKIVDIMKNNITMDLVRYSHMGNKYHEDYTKKECKNTLPQVNITLDGINFSQCSQWSDQNHIAKLEHYKYLVWKKTNPLSFMEDQLMCYPVGNNYKRIWYLGDINDGHYSDHTDGRNG